MGKEHFDSKAADWDNDPAKVAHARHVAEAVAGAVPVSPRTRLLEYGAGTGLVTQALVGRSGPATLADSSPGMRGVIGDKIAAGVLPGARVWDLDLEEETAPDERFDLVLASLVLHHVRELDQVLVGFAAMLEPGGHLCIADLDRTEGIEHDFDGHHGFDRTELAAQLSAAGFVDVSVQDCTELVREGVTHSVFLAVGRRGA